VTGFTSDEGEDVLADLAARAGEGDERALAALLNQLESKIRRWAATMTTDADSADDLAQLTFIRLHERAGQFDRRSRLTSWVYGMMRNLASDARRADARRAERERQASVELREVQAGGRDEAAEGKRLAAILASYRSMLSDREQQVFELADLRGVATAVIATQLKIAPATVRVLLLRARHKLRTQMLQGLIPDEGESR